MSNGMREIIYYVFHAVLIGVFSYVYAIILTKPGKLLSPIVKIIDPFFMQNGKFLKWIYDPIINCVYCNSGQVALWTYIFYYWGHEYNLFYHLGFISMSIMTVHILINKYGR